MLLSISLMHPIQPILLQVKRGALGGATQYPEESASEKCLSPKEPLQARYPLEPRELA